MLRLDTLAAAILPIRYQLATRYWYKRLRRDLDPELGLLNTLARGPGRAIDIGASYGLYTYAFSRRYRCVEAFEPLPGGVSVIEACGARNVHVHPVALSSTPGTRALFVPKIRNTWDTGRASFTEPKYPSRVVPVNVRALDEYAFRDVAVIKIDVEGHELDVLRGAAETLEREQPVLLVEIEQRHLTIPIVNVFQHLQGARYRGFFLYEGQLKTIASFDYETHQRPWLTDTDNRCYINNFLFVPDATPHLSRPS